MSTPKSIIDKHFAAYSERVAAIVSPREIAMADAPLTPCPKCGAPCTTKVEMRGGDHGWGTTDAERTTYRWATPSPPVAAPHGDLVAVPRATLISWRQWAAQSMSHAIEHEIAEMCAQPQPAQPLTVDADAQQQEAP